VTLKELAPRLRCSLRGKKAAEIEAVARPRPRGIPKTSVLGFAEIKGESRFAELGSNLRAGARLTNKCAKFISVRDRRHKSKRAAVHGAKTAPLSLRARIDVIRKKSKRAPNKGNHTC
jgi:hypothetical protein